MPKFAKEYIANYVFITALIILVVNDHILKAAFHNWFTGKLSDFAGMILLPLLIAYFFPKLRHKAVIVSAVVFLFWKSPYSQTLIDAYNQLAFIPITRVVDYSDMLALLILPIPLEIINYPDKFKFKSMRIKPVFIVAPCLFAFIATSPPPSYYYSYASGNVKFDKLAIKVKYSKPEILEKLQAMNIKVISDSVGVKDHLYRMEYNSNYYAIPELIIEKDTIRNLNFALRSLEDNKTTIYLNSITLEKDMSKQEIKEEITSYYQKGIKKYFKTIFKK